MRIEKRGTPGGLVVLASAIAMVVAAFVARRSDGPADAAVPFSGNLPEVSGLPAIPRNRVPATARSEASVDAVERRVDSSRRPGASTDAAVSKEHSRRERRELAMARYGRAPDSESFVTGDGRRWRVREDLQALAPEEARSRGIVKGQAGVRFIGGRAIVASEGARDAGNSGGTTVVEDERTGRLGVLTGSVVVRLKSWLERDAFLMRFPSNLRGQSERIRMLVIRPSAETDLSDFARLVRADSAVESAEIEIIDRQMEPK